MPRQITAPIRRDPLQAAGIGERQGQSGSVHILQILFDIAVEQRECRGVAALRVRPGLTPEQWAGGSSRGDIDSPTQQFASVHPTLLPCFSSDPRPIILESPAFNTFSSQ